MTDPQFAPNPAAGLAGYEPMTTIEIEAATNAKGETNVSFRVKLQTPTAEALANPDGVVAQAQRLVDGASLVAAYAKDHYELALELRVTDPGQFAWIQRGIAENWYGATHTLLRELTGRAAPAEKSIGDAVEEMAQEDGSYPSDRAEPYPDSENGEPWDDGKLHEGVPI